MSSQHPAYPAVAAAAANDLYGDFSTLPAIHRTATGEVIDNHAIAVGRAAGYLGDYQPDVVLPDGTSALPLPITDAGRAWHDQQQGG